MFQCPGCGGGGCDECNRGEWDLGECPRRFVGPGGEIWEVIEFAEFYEKGLPPVIGGVLDQTRAFVEAARFVWHEQAVYKAKLKMWWT